MADVWSGDIILNDDIAVRDIILATQNVASTCAVPASPLRFLSAVAIARIPLYLATGPSLDVWTTSEDTQRWFASILLSKAALGAEESSNNATRGWWNCARAQSPIGILVEVKKEEGDVTTPRITEILFYGTIAPKSVPLPTPPDSSQEHAHPGDLPELRVHALPLSSDLLYRPSLSATSPVSPALGTSDAQAPKEPQYLPSPFALRASHIGSPKRKHDKIFDNAEQLRRKARRKGGEGVAAAAARNSNFQQPPAHRKSLSIDMKASPFPEFRPGSAGAALSGPASRSLSRSPSISSDSRPSSRNRLPAGQAHAETKRSTLSQVATVPLQPEEPTTETRNKEALSRVVLAAMRMHGLQQRKKTNRSRRASVVPGAGTPADSPTLSDEAAAEEAAKDEEFKLIYHQTFKGAALALRKHFTTKPLHLQPDSLRDVVEKLLDIFCTDPLEVPAPEPVSHTPLATPGQRVLDGYFGITPRVTQGTASPFDLPSGRRVAPVTRNSKPSEVYTGSPVSRAKPLVEQQMDKRIH